ncbi:hypothetical protein K438DRAFT_1977562 [Mycena galopus ATCC 62051]|nr:hypothetical protein K438DRAFT_1977562 [Mycena galopus ATCC 62051]
MLTEFSNGEVIGGQELGQIREELNALLMDVLAAGKATSRLALLGHQVRGALVYMLEHRFPYLSLCMDNWKAHRVIAGRYRFWVKPLISKGLIRNDGGSDSGGDDNDNDNATSGSKRKGSRVLPDPATNPSLLRLSTTHDNPPADPPQEPLAPEQPETTQLHGTPPSGLDSGPPGSPARTPPTVNEPDDDLFTSVLVPPPLPTPSPPPSSTPAVVTTTTPPVTEPAASVASKKACKPNPIHFTPRNLYMAVYADEVGGSSNEFTQHWLSLATENPGLLQAYETYSKELVMYSLLSSELCLICIYRSFKSSRTYLRFKIFDSASKLFSKVPLRRRSVPGGSAQQLGG